ncbi:hypothetical protein Q9Q99_01810 [Curtobacterium flaccumfaciens]|nr:hypothetical protein Q9Q99_01810 [Curtobacterium flaccumfaciens]
MSTTNPTTPAAPTFAGAWTAWRDDHEQARASEHGFLAISSIRWLTATPERFEDAPGSWSTDEDGPVVALADGESIEVDGQHVSGTHPVRPAAGALEYERGVARRRRDRGDRGRPARRQRPAASAAPLEPDARRVPRHPRVRTHRTPSSWTPTSSRSTPRARSPSAASSTACCTSTRPPAS